MLVTNPEVVEGPDADFQAPPFEVNRVAALRAEPQLVHLDARQVLEPAFAHVTLRGHGAFLSATFPIR